MDLTAKTAVEDLSDEELMERTRKALLDMGITQTPKLLSLVPGKPVDSPEDND